MTEWFRMSKQELMGRLKTGEEGLTGQEAERRLLEYGENVIRETGRQQWWQVFLEQFKDLLVVILLAAAGISMVTGDPGSAGVIFAVLFLNAVLGTIQASEGGKILGKLKIPVLPRGQGQTAQHAGGDSLLPGGARRYPSFGGRGFGGGGRAAD